MGVHGVPGVQKRILVVGGYERTRRALFGDLVTAFEVSQAESSTDALEQVESVAQLDALVIDVALRDDDGRPGALELLERLQRCRPAAGRVLLVPPGFASDRVLRSGLAHACVMQPWEQGEVRSAVLRVLARQTFAAAQLLGA